MNARLIAAIVISVCEFAGAAGGGMLFSEERKLNNFVSELLEASSISKSGESCTFTRSSDGWIFISSTCNGTASIIMDKSDTVIVHDATGSPRREAMRFVTRGEHTIKVEGKGNLTLEQLTVK